MIVNNLQLMAEKKLQMLLDQYKESPSILQKIEEFIDNSLPKQILNVVEKEKRHELLTSKMEMYITTFFSDPNTQFYYISTSNIFIHYIDEHYKIISEDEIWHTILSDISSKKVLLDWKYKVKTRIIKLIREKDIFHSIPESATIQYVLNFLTSSFFKTKEQSKYFLTCIGDSILKRNNGLMHFINPIYKPFITNIQDSSYFLFNNTISLVDSFKYRYHEHNYETSRLLHFDRLPPLGEYWQQFTKTYILDIIIVACHYSNRFLSSDKYLVHHCNDNSLQEYAMYLKDKTQDNIVQDFIDSYLIVDDSYENLSITWQNMYFLWKEYLKAHDFPNIIFKESLKTNLMNTLTFNDDKGSFIKVSSIYLKYVQFFRKFWDETIFDASNNIFEIGELCSIYKDWLKNNHPGVKYLPEHKMIALIQYFYSQHQITNEKYINNISSTLWNKKEDIKQSLFKMKQRFTDSQNLYQMYEFYCNFIKKEGFIYTAGKKYFENTIKELISVEYFSGDTVITDYWKL